MKLSVGLPSLTGQIERYAKRMSLLELRTDPGQLPRTQRLRQWLTVVPAGFVFSVRLPASVCALPKTIDPAALTPALRAADVLGARWLVLQTPPTVTPDPRTLARLQELVGRLPRDKHLIAWEPRGVWEAKETERLAQAMDVCLVRDIARDPAPPGPNVYTRLRALGQAKLGQDALELALERVHDREQVAVVIDGPSGPRVAQLLRRLAADLADLDEDAGLDEDADLDEDDDDAGLDDDDTDER
jgi:uncharacterized protein YecE (DUF72 family)